MFIDASAKEFTFVNNAIPSHDIAFEHIYYTTRWLPMFTKNLVIFLKTKHSISICQSFSFTLVQSFRINRDRDVGQYNISLIIIIEIFH